MAKSFKYVQLRMTPTTYNLLSRAAKNAGESLNRFVTKLLDAVAKPQEEKP